MGGVSARKRHCRRISKAGAAKRRKQECGVVGEGGGVSGGSVGESGGAVGESGAVTGGAVGESGVVRGDALGGVKSDGEGEDKSITMVEDGCAGDDDVDTPCSMARSSVTATPDGNYQKDPEYIPETPVQRIMGDIRAGTTPFLTADAQLDQLVYSINQTSQCSSVGCNGKLLLKRVELEGLGGEGKAYFSCSGCSNREITLPCSSPYKDSGHTSVSVGLQVAFIGSGANYAQYERILGMFPVSGKAFYKTIQMIYEPVKELLNEQCELGKTVMKDAPSDEIGSWDRAVTVGDGAWMTTGAHSQNFTFHVRDYIRNSVLYYLHFCQRGKDKICTDPLYQGTSKSCEGTAARKVFRKMKEEGMMLVTHWQDADSTSAKEVSANFGPNKTMLCGGHYTRAHFNHLKKIAKQKSFGPMEISKHLPFRQLSVTVVDTNRDVAV